MVEPSGLRDRKKAQTRQRIADVAATLFAERGYEAVSMVEVARRAEVSDQTVYNYFPAKQDLVLDRAGEIRDWYGQAVHHRKKSQSPARALEPFVIADIERYRAADLDATRGEFLAQCVESPVLRRFALEERERQTHTIAQSITASTPELPMVVAHAHAAALVAVIQMIHDQIGTSIIDHADQNVSADNILATAHTGFASLEQTFADLITAPGHHRGSGPTGRHERNEKVAR